MKKHNEKFTEKYGVDSATIYKGAVPSVRIPPPGHPLHDPTAPTTFNEARTALIDARGEMKQAITVFSDPDEGILWTLDGRGRWLDVEEANRRRKQRDAELIEPYLVPFRGTEKEAIEYVRVFNYHRRAPKLSGMGLDIMALRRQGCTWERCAEVLAVETKDAEQWGRALLPLAYCVPEVQAAFDRHDLPLSAAKQFGGGAVDGAKALGKKAQLELLAEKLTKKGEKAAKAPTLPQKARERVVDALSNGATEQLRKDDREIARIVKATLEFVGGQKKALKELPDEVAAIVTKALEPLPKGPKKPAKGS